MPIYEVLRNLNKDVEGSMPIETMLIQPGKFTLTESGLSIPCHIEKDESVRLFLKRAKGPRNVGILFGIRDGIKLCDLDDSFAEIRRELRWGHTMVGIINEQEQIIRTIERQFRSFPQSSDCPESK